MLCAIGILLHVLIVTEEVGAEQGILVLHVSDVKDRPMVGVQIATEGDGATGPPTDGAGKTRIRLAPQTRPGTQVTLQIVRAPGQRDLVFISPWNRTTQVPPFENESNNYIPTVLAERADQELLKNPAAVRAIAANINQANAPQAVGGGTRAETAEERRQRALSEVARQYGFSTGDVDAAIRAWGKKTTDPYETGLAALYERDYPVATKRLQDSFDLRKQEETQAQQAAAETQEKTADAAFFLGQSLFEQGRYREAGTAFREVYRRRPDDALALNAFGLSLLGTPDYASAEPLFRRALTIREKTLGPEHPTVATSLNNLAMVLKWKGDLAGAEPLYRRALAIDEKALGPEHPEVAADLNNLAGLLHTKGDTAGAELLYRRALAIKEKALGPEHRAVATTLNNLAMLLQDKGDTAGAESLYRRALAIDEKALGPDHPSTKTIRSNLDALQRTGGKAGQKQ